MSSMSLSAQLVLVYSVIGHPSLSSFRESSTRPLEPAAAGLCQGLNLHSEFYAAIRRGKDPDVVRNDLQGMSAISSRNSVSTSPTLNRS